HCWCCPRVMDGCGSECGAAGDHAGCMPVLDARCSTSMQDAGQVGWLASLTHQYALMYYRPMPAATDLARLTRQFRALSDETRLKIIDLLRRGERCVCELTEALDVAQSLLSFHLRTLKDAGLVTDRREGRWS